MSNVIGSKISSAKFTWNPETREFSAEISELQHGGTDPLGRLYNDSADAGFVMISHKTGKEISFCVVNESKDSEHEIRFWVLQPVPGIYDERVTDIKVFILND